MALTKISTAMISQSAAAVDLNVDAGTFYVDTTNNRVGVGGKTDPDTPLHVVGTATATLFAGSGASLTSIPNAALVNSSITINSTAVSLGGSLTLTTANIAENTNLYYTDARADARIAAADTDDLSEGSSNLYYTDARVDARVSGGSLGNITTTGYIRGPSSFTIDPAAHGDDTGTVVIAGNLQVDGVTTTINSTTLTVDDKNITLASGSVNAAAADGAGFTVDIGSGTLPAITYDGTNDEWDFNKPLNVTGNIGVSGTVDGVDIAARDAVLTSTTTTAGAALPKAGGTMTGDIFINGGSTTERNVRIQNTSNVLYAGVEGSSGNRFVGSSAGNAFFGTTSDSGLEFATHNNVRMVVDGDGNVGIGTDSPLVKLDVRGSPSAPAASGTAQTGSLRVSQTTGNGVLDMGFYTSATGTAWIQSTNKTNLATNYGLTLQPNGGNVGIGTDAPGVPLHVKKTGSTSAVQEFLRFENHALGGAGAGSSINFHHYHAGGGPAGGALAASINAQNMASWPAGTPSSYSTGLTFSTLHENTFDERMRIDSSGNVGIGSSSSLDSSLNLNNNQAFARVLAADNSGTLRVGQRHVANNSNSLVIMGATHNTYYPASFVVDSSYANNITTYDLTAYGVDYLGWNGAMSFKISNGASTVTEMLSLTPGGAVFPTGNVGIGENNPGAKLDVNGAIKLSGSGNGQEVQFVKAQGGTFSTVTIELQFPSAGSYNYEVGVSGTSGCAIQFGGGYTNGVSNFSHTGNQQVGGAWTVTSPSSNLVRLVSPSSTVGTHPTAYVKARFGLSDGFDESDISITFS